MSAEGTKVTLDDGEEYAAVDTDDIDGHEVTKSQVVRYSIEGATGKQSEINGDYEKKLLEPTVDIKDDFGDNINFDQNSDTYYCEENRKWLCFIHPYWVVCKEHEIPNAYLSIDNESIIARWKTNSPTPSSKSDYWEVYDGKKFTIDTNIKMTRVVSYGGNKRSSRYKNSKSKRAKKSKRKYKISRKKTYKRRK